ncbi:MAG: endonuclease, partial [Caldilineaceae bacterium]|nr:endonuclease [Caldilineaceae bacterium]
RPIRIFNYNLHNGFDPDGRLTIEEMAQAIEAENPDVVLLQEVARGWLIYGSLDMLEWLSQRLGMAYVYAPTTGPLWGNAILSRLPIENVEQHTLPPRDLLLRRGFVTAQVDTGGDRPLNVIDTHLHNPDDGSDVRVHQVETLLDYVQDLSGVVLAGDLNAEPDSPEMKMLEAAGLRDAVAEAGVLPDFTFPSRGASKRIDYIWLSPDLTPSEVAIPTVRCV